MPEDYCPEVYAILDFEADTQYRYIFVWAAQVATCHRCVAIERSACVKFK